MSAFKEAREAYEQIPLPEELNDRIQAGIRQGKANRRKRRCRRNVGSVAACFVVLVGILNVSPVVALAAADVPVLGGLFQILTVRDYETMEQQTHYCVTVPEIQAESGLADEVNQEIQRIVDGHIEEAEQMWEGYREAFLATGGTEEEWEQRTMNVLVDYEVKSQKDTMVSFTVDLAQGAVNSNQIRYCYNLDLKNDRNLTLEDILGKDWKSICNDAINRYIADSVDEDGYTVFFAPEAGGFTSVDADTDFYVEEDGTVVTVFPEYAIAAGVAGIVEIPVN